MLQFENYPQEAKIQLNELVRRYRLLDGSDDQRKHNMERTPFRVVFVEDGARASEAAREISQEPATSELGRLVRQYAPSQDEFGRIYAAYEILKSIGVNV